METIKKIGAAIAAAAQFAVAKHRAGRRWLATEFVPAHPNFTVGYAFVTTVLAIPTVLAIISWVRS
jgi:hypothetical protein